MRFSLLKLHGMIVKGLEPCFLLREPHTDVPLVDCLELGQVISASRCTVKRAHATPPVLRSKAVTCIKTLSR